MALKSHWRDLTKEDLGLPDYLEPQKTTICQDRFEVFCLPFFPEQPCLTSLIIFCFAFPGLMQSFQLQQPQQHHQGAVTMARLISKCENITLDR